MALELLGLIAMATKTRLISFAGLDAVNFFLPEISTLVMPFLAIFLREKGWEYSQIGLALGAASLGSLILQIPVGYICDVIKAHRLALALSAFCLGICYFAIPFVVKSPPLTLGILFLSGFPGAFFTPLLASLAVALAGQKHLDSTLGRNRGWNHFGSLVGALLAMAVVKTQGLAPLFLGAAGMSILATVCVLLIRPRDLVHHPLKPVHAQKSWGKQIKSFINSTRQVMLDPSLRRFLVTLVLFHFAGLPSTSLATLYMQRLGGSESLVAVMTFFVQPCMILAAWTAGNVGPKVGHRQLLTISLFILPLRMILYTFAKTPEMVLVITMLDGVGAGIFGVASVLICNDLARSVGFNFLLSLMCSAPSLGAVAGNATKGFLLQNFGFRSTFLFFAAVSLGVAIHFLLHLQNRAEQSDSHKRLSPRALTHR